MGASTFLLGAIVCLKNCFRWLQPARDAVVRAVSLN